MKILGIQEVPKFEKIQFLKKSRKYALIIPVVNEGERFKAQLVNLRSYTKLVDIIIVDGKSTDGSTEKSFLKKQKVRTLLKNSSSTRLGTQLRIGIFYALREGYKSIICMDGNGKDDVAAIPLFIKYLNKGYDFIQGSRFLPKGEAFNTPLERYLAIKCIHVPITNYTSGFHYTDSVNGFKGFSSGFLLDPKVQPFRSVFDGYNLQSYLTICAPKLGFKTIEVPVARRYPKGKVPTKIKGFLSRFIFLYEFLAAALGRYDIN